MLFKINKILKEKFPNDSNKKWDNDFCAFWNTGNCTFGEKCRYQHCCPFCFDNKHTATQCTATV